MKRREPRKHESSPIALGGEVVKESLPLPFVFYPDHYGTFFAFARSERDVPALCNCVRGAVANYLDLDKQNPAPRYDSIDPDADHPVLVRPDEKLLRFFGGVWEEPDPVLESPLHRAFPRRLAETALERDAAPMEWLTFREKLCHRCNSATPSLQWCHEMYGGPFMKRYGWYASVAAYRLGVDALSLSYLHDLCPDEIIQDIENSQLVAEELQRFRNQWGDVPSMMTPELADQHRLLSRASDQARRRITTRFENIAREEFGFADVGERWISESLLAKIVERLFPGERILRHDHPVWLGRLELDIFLPDRRLALEYQGQQHYDAVDLWGGDEALFALQERDRRKVELCEENSVVLVAIDYTEPLTDEHIRNRLSEHGVSPPSRTPSA